MARNIESIELFFPLASPIAIANTKIIRPKIRERYFLINGITNDKRTKSELPNPRRKEDPILLFKSNSI